ncbi:MAG: tetraacyldisaccharide 4'-kinase [Alphaproteobacteria bacterium]|nr:tetraacyldisaccharide 4'-kinase [Alphaproteobacteria bacterium]
MPSRKARLLLPFSALYALGYMVRRAFTVQVKLPVPVVCIGNVTAGGGGKTPMALHIGAMLKEKNIAAFYVSRGYGGRADGPVMVNPERHRSYEVGDEPLLLSQVLPTVVGKNRLQAAQYAIAKGAKLLIFDDGFQNKKIFKDFSFLVVDGTVGFGNGLLFPAGPLRERFSSAVKRAHSIVLINPKQGAIPLPDDRPVLFARTRVTGLAERLQGQKVVAFCGIAFPEKFMATLIGLGARVIEFAAYGDHLHYRHDTLLPLAEIASKEKAYMVTTRKDFVRLPRGFKDKVVVVDIALEFGNPEVLDAQISYIAGLL